MKKLLVLLIGPSGSGKTPACKSISYKLHTSRECVIWTSRKPLYKRGEKNGIDYFFSTRSTINSLPSCGFIKKHVHSDLQAVDTVRLLGALSMHGIIVMDIFHTFLHGRLVPYLESKGVQVIKIFLTPVSTREFCSSPDKVLLAKRCFGQLSFKGEKQDPYRRESAITEITEAFYKPNLYDGIIDTVPENIWDKEENPLDPKNKRIKIFLDKLLELIMNKAPWTRAIRIKN